MSKASLHCAIYTRKSSEEGLEQSFNSLDAQREACEAFIKSQQHEGWKLVPTFYDDGGYSGGNMTRPALKQLLTDIEQKRVNVVVVYKVDRLTRSLADFAKIVEQFDAKGVSFVSVTQQFNTTSSMGRLTLNVLLSFAQFEREVTGERIRDKIAASKQKGMWMGGTPPIGYIGHERTLQVDDVAASLIRTIYTEYLKVGSVWALKASLDAKQIVSPIRISNAKRAYGGTSLTRGQLYRILSDPVYLGQIGHHKQVYPGQHPAILDQSLWDEVQAQTLQNKQGHRIRNTRPSMSLLVGILFDKQGNRLTPSHTQKQSKRYRYYVSEVLTISAKKTNTNNTDSDNKKDKDKDKDIDHHHKVSDEMRLPARELESVVVEALKDWLGNQDQLINTLGVAVEEIEALLYQAKGYQRALDKSATDQFNTIQSLIQRVEVHPQQLSLYIQTDALFTKDRENRHSSPIYLQVPAEIKRCGHSMKLLVSGQRSDQPTPNHQRLIGIAKGHDWLHQLTTGKVTSVSDIAKQEGVVISQITRTIYRAFLAPEIVRAILNSSQPIHLTPDFIKQHLPLPLDWEAQKQVLKFNSSTSP